MLPESSPLQSCPSCDALVDITELEPLKAFACPGCGERMVADCHIGPYEVLAMAGRGGMGVVYRAYDATLDRQIAVKLLRKDRRLIQQLETEAAITATVNHPNVVRVYSTGTDRCRFYLAMELVEHGSLDDLIRQQGRVLEKDVLRIGIDIAKGLRAAHQHGLIHRDVKPANILFAAHTAKIVDFGLAIFAENEEASRGEIFGTPYYVAPEKLAGEAEDFRSDMYSLGGTLFHALAGRPPFEAETASLVALKHLKNQSVSIATFAPWVTGATAFVINKTLLRNPADRFRNYDELIGHLEFALGEVLKAGDQPIRRNRLVLETAEDRQRAGWLGMAMLGIFLLFLIGAFLLRDQLFGGRKVMQPDSRAQMAQMAQQDRPRTVAKDFALRAGLSPLATGSPEAAAYFRSARANRELSDPDRAWAALLEGTAELGAEHSEQARAAFALVPELAAKTADQALTNFLVKIANRVNVEQPIPPREAQEIDRGGYESIALLLYGLRNWQLGDFEDGGAFLRQFRSALPSGSSAWIGELKGMVNSRIEQIVGFEMQVSALKTAAGASERENIAAAFRRLPEPLSTRGLELVATANREANRSTSMPLSNGWKHADFGRLPVQSEATFGAASGVFTIKTTSGDIFDKQDSGHFVYKAVTGDFEIIARVVGVADGNEYAKGGVMIRDGTSADSRNTFVAMAPTKGFTVQRRFVKEGNSTGTAPYWWTDLTGTRWLKLVREGNRITSFQSEDGRQWTEVTTDNFDSLPRQLLAGLAVSSHDLQRRTTATFDHVSITRNPQPNYRVLDLRLAATADNRVGLFIRPTDPDVLHFQRLGKVTVHDIPFEILDPSKTISGKSLVVLKGGLGNAQNYPQRVVVPCGGIPIKALHILSGVGAWAYPWSGDGKNLPAAKLTIVDTQGRRQEIVFKDGVEFADYVKRIDVAGSDFADDLTTKEQVRVIHVDLPEPAQVEMLLLESFNNHIAPVFAAITAE
jgi:predicted RNA-binding Zn-ribbon protein involved in translation (DUF1610 family)